MLTTPQKRALNDVLLDYWQEMSASDIVEDVTQFADPIEAAKYIEHAAAFSEECASAETESEPKEYYLNEAKKFRRVAQLLRR